MSWKLTVGVGMCRAMAALVRTKKFECRCMPQWTHTKIVLTLSLKFITVEYFFLPQFMELFQK